MLPKMDDACFINQSQFDRAENALGPQFQALEAQAMLGLEDFPAGHSGSAELRLRTNVSDKCIAG